MYDINAYTCIVYMHIHVYVRLIHAYIHTLVSINLSALPFRVAPPLKPQVRQGPAAIVLNTLDAGLVVAYEGLSILCAAMAVQDTLHEYMKG